MAKNKAKPKPCGNLLHGLRVRCATCFWSSISSLISALPRSSLTRLVRLSKPSSHFQPCSLPALQHTLHILLNSSNPHKRSLICDIEVSDTRQPSSLGHFDTWRFDELALVPFFNGLLFNCSSYRFLFFDAYSSHPFPGKPMAVPLHLRNNARVKIPVRFERLSFGNNYIAPITKYLSDQTDLYCDASSSSFYIQGSQNKRVGEQGSRGENLSRLGDLQHVLPSDSVSSHFPIFHYQCRSYDFVSIARLLDRYHGRLHWASSQDIEWVHNRQLQERASLLRVSSYISPETQSLSLTCQEALKFLNSGSTSNTPEPPSLFDLSMAPENGACQNLSISKQPGTLTSRASNFSDIYGSLGAHSAENDVYTVYYHLSREALLSHDDPCPFATLVDVWKGLSVISIRSASERVRCGGKIVNRCDLLNDGDATLMIFDGEELFSLIRISTHREEPFKRLLHQHAIRYSCKGSQLSILDFPSHGNRRDVLIKDSSKVLPRIQEIKNELIELDGLRSFAF